MHKSLILASAAAAALNSLTFFSGPAAPASSATGYHDFNAARHSPAEPDATVTAQLEKSGILTNAGSPLSKLVNITFEKAFIVFGDETFSAVGGGG